MTSLTHRFPKWLTEEMFELAFNPSLKPSQRFCVTLFDDIDEFNGFGYSIAEAAKHALQLREKWT